MKRQQTDPLCGDPNCHGCSNPGCVGHRTTTTIELATHKCGRCGERMRQVENPVKGSDSWHFLCPNGHKAWIGK